MRLVSILPLVVSMACGQQNVTALPSTTNCTVQVSYTGDVAQPGDMLVLTGGPFTSVQDTLLVVDAQPAPVDAVSTSSEDDNTDSGDAIDCAARCICIEHTITFTLPISSSSPSSTVQLFNGYGSSELIEIAVAATDTDTDTNSTP